MHAVLTRAVLDEADPASVAAKIERLKRRHPRASRDELASRLIRSTARECAAAGLAWSAPASYFGALPTGPDLAFQIAALNRLIVALGAVYGSDSSVANRAAGLAVGLGAGFAADFVRRGVVAILSRSLPRSPAARAAAGGLVGGALAYGVAMAVGNVARDAFAGRAAFLPRLRFR